MVISLIIVLLKKKCIKKFFSGIRTQDSSDFCMLNALTTILNLEKVLEFYDHFVYNLQAAIFDAVTASIVVKEF